MSNITFTATERQQLCDKLNRYLIDELDTELGQFDVEFLVDFISKELGGYYYNRGLYDAQALISAKIELMHEAITELEKPV